jgi:hypothetical protein
MREEWSMKKQKLVYAESIRTRARKRVGRAFELACKCCIFEDTEDKWILVHGYGYRIIFASAWLEWDGIVYDPVEDIEMPEDDYNEEYGVVPLIKYSRLEANHKVWVKGHYGPWWDDAWYWSIIKRSYNIPDKSQPALFRKARYQNSNLAIVSGWGQNSSSKKDTGK